MFSVSNLTPYCQGFQSAYNLQTAKAREDTIKQGKNYYLSLPNQFKQIALTFAQFNRLIPHISSYTKTCGLGSTLAMWSTMTVTVAAAYYQHNKYKTFTIYFNNVVDLVQIKIPFNISVCKLNPELTQNKERVFKVLSEHIGDISQAVSVITTIALYALGQEKEAITWFVITGIGYLDRQGYLPQRVSVFYSSNVKVLAALAAVVIGSPLQKLIGLVDAISLLTPSFLKLIQNPIDRMCHRFYAENGIHYPLMNDVALKDTCPPTVFKLSGDLVDRILQNNSSFLVDPTHVQRTPQIKLEMNPDVKIDQLLGLYDNIQWDSKSFEVIRNKVVQDDRFLKEHSEHLITGANDRRSTTLTDEELKTWVRKQLDLFIQNMNGKKKPTGNLVGFDKSQKNAQFVTQYMVALSKEGLDKEPSTQTELQNLFFILAIEGGDYCAPGLTRAVNFAKTSILSKKGNDFLGFEGKIDFALMQYREHILQSIYYNQFNLLKKTKPTVAEFTFGDTHSFNDFLRALGDGLGIDLSSANQDSAFEVSPLSKMMFDTFTPLSRYIFWSHATPVHPSDTLALLEHKISRQFSYVANSSDHLKSAWNQSANTIGLKLRKCKAVIIHGYQYAKTSFVAYRTFGLFVFPTVLSVFKKTLQYDVQSLIDVVKEEFHNGNITPKEIQDWWTLYIQTNSHFNDGFKTTFAENIWDIETGADKTSPYEENPIQVTKENGEENQKLTDSFLRVMLTEMGYLRLAPEPTS